ncbi:MAG: glycosyltransferase family 2 protein [Flavitalea sp.]
MSQTPHISICIPAFKRIDFIRRLLDSIQIQEFKDFEVIVTDDSPDESVKQLCSEYSSKGFVLKYYRNPVALGTPENWNEGIRKSTGKWIKLMHDDDWFEGPKALLHYAKASEQFTDAEFIFAAYTNHYAQSGKIEKVKVNGFRMRAMLREPASLFSKNIIGPPSVVLHRNDGKVFYDKTIKWVVDIDFYIRYLQNAKPFYIDKTLVNVGLGDHQVTMDCVRQRPVEIPENFYLLHKIGFKKLKNWLVFDAFWRLMRNLEIRSIQDIRDSGYNGEIPPVIDHIIREQNKLGTTILKNGVGSKLYMFVNYLKYKSQIN